MPIPVVQLGTGNVGIHALRALITNPEFELRWSLGVLGCQGR